MAHRTSAISSGQPRRHQHLHCMRCRTIQEISQVPSKSQQQVGKVHSHKQLWCDDCTQEGLLFAYTLLCTRNCSNQRVWWHAASTVDSTHWRQAVPWRMSGVLLAILLMYSSMAGVCSNRIYSSTTKNCLRQTAVHLHHASVRLSAGCMSAAIAVWIISRSLCDMQAWAWPMLWVQRGLAAAHRITASGSVSTPHCSRRPSCCSQPLCARREQL